MSISRLDPRFQKMLSARGFREVLNEEYAKELRENPDTSRSWVFDRLNDEYCEVMGSARYIDYYTFCSAERRDRAVKRRKINHEEDNQDLSDRSPDQNPGNGA